MNGDITRRPIMIVLGLIVSAFVAGVGAYVFLQSQLEKEVKNEFERRLVSFNMLIEKKISEEWKKFKSEVLPRGTIVAFFAKNGKIPKGWVICNGDNKTPDLRGKFIRGVGILKENGETGGENKHILTINRPRIYLATGGTDHKKALMMEGGKGIINHQTYCGDCKLVNSFVEAQKAIIHELDNRPEYCDLVFIMKVN